MLHRPYGPRGAESEPQFWTDLTRSNDFAGARHLSTGASQRPGTLYPPADAHQDRQTIDDENLASHNDPLGSWTGVPDQADGRNADQDQDDL